MRRGIVVLLFVVPAAALCAGGGRDVVPEWAKWFPAETLLVVGVDDFSSTVKELFDVPVKDAKGVSLYKMVDEAPSKYREKILEAFKDFSGLGSYFHDSVAVGLVGESREELKPLFVAPIKQEGLGFADYLKFNLFPILSMKGQLSLSVEGGFFVIYFGTEEEDAPKLYYTIHEEMLYASSDRSVIERAIANPVEKGLSLHADPTFVTFCRSLRERGLVVYFNSARLYEMSLEKMGSYGKIVCEAFGLDDVDCIGLGMGRTGSHVLVEGVIIFREAFEGLPRMIAQPDIDANAVYLVPKDYSIFASVSTMEADGAWFAWKEAVKKVVDDIGWAEYERYLKDWDEEHGVSFVEEIIENLGEGVAGALRFKAEQAKPDVLLIVEVMDKKKAIKSIESALEKKELLLVKEKRNRPGDLLYSFYVDGVEYSYAFHKKFLVAAKGKGLVTEALRTLDDEESLDTAKVYRAIEEDLSEGHIAFVYIDEKHLDEYALRWLEGHVMDEADGEGDAEDGGEEEVDVVEEPPEGDIEGLEIGMEEEAEEDVIDKLREEYPEVLSEDFVKGMRERLDKVSKSLSATTFCARMEGDVLTLSTSVSLVQTRYVLNDLVGQLPPIIIEQRAKANEVRSFSNVKQICLAAKIYSMENKEKFPDKLSQLYPTYLDSLEVLKSPGATSMITKDNIDSASNYILVKGLSEEMPSDSILVYEKKPLRGNRVNVGFVDGSASTMTVEELNRMLEKQRLNRERKR